MALLGKGICSAEELDEGTAVRLEELGAAKTLEDDMRGKTEDEMGWIVFAEELSRGIEEEESLVEIEEEIDRGLEDAGAMAAVEEELGREILVELEERIGLLVGFSTSSHNPCALLQEQNKLINTMLFKKVFNLNSKGCPPAWESLVEI